MNRPAKTARARRLLASPATLLFFIILFFLLDRAMSAGFLLPGFCVEDERWLQEGALTIVRGLTLDPGTHKYPGLMFYLTAAVYAGIYAGRNLLALLHFESLDSFSYHLAHYQFGFVRTIVAGRLLAAALGAAALALYYRLVRREYGPERALGAVFLAAGAPAVLFSTQLLKNDSLVLVGVMLTLLAALRLLERGGRRDYLLGGLALGFCLAAKYHFAAAAPLLVAHRLRHPELGPLASLRRPRWLLLVPAALLGFFLLSPHTFLDFPGALRQAALELALQNKLNPLLRRSPELWWHAPFLFQLLAALPLALGIPLYLLALAGLVRSRPWRRGPDDPRRLVLWSYPAAFLLMMALVSKLGVPHLFSPAAPFAALLAAGAIAPGLGVAARWKRLLATTALAAVMLSNLALFHGFSRLEDRVLTESVETLAAYAVPGENCIALVPYYPNPERDWPMTFYPQFLLSRSLLAQQPNRILLHHAYYNAFLDNPDLMRRPAVADMTILYLELRAGRAGYRETDRFTGGFFTGSWYIALLPDLKGLMTSIYEREPAAGKY